MKTLIASLALAVSCHAAATVYDLHNKPMATPHLYKASGSNPWYVDAQGHYYELKPTQKGADNWFYGCKKFYANSDINNVLKFNKGNPDCNMKMIAPNQDGLATAYEPWFYPSQLRAKLLKKHQRRDA